MTRLAKKETSWSYEQLTQKLEESNRMEESRRRILKKKRDERAAIKRAGGGHALARAIMPEDTDFNYGHNERLESIDERIAGEQADRCMGQVICKKCGKFHGYCVEITEEKEKLKMLPTGDNDNNRRRTTGGLNFINTPDLSTSPTEAKILLVKFTEKGKQGPSITLKLAFKGEIRYLWIPCRKSDARYKTMIDSFGADENNWIDERIQIALEKDEFTEGYRTIIRVMEKKGKK